MSKKLIFAQLSLCTLFPITAMAQGAHLPIEEVIRLFTFLNSHYTTFPAFVGLVVTGFQYLKKAIPIKGEYARYLSWGISIALAFCGYFLNLGIFANQVWWETLSWGLGAALAANGLYNIPEVTRLLNTISRIKK